MILDLHSQAPKDFKVISFVGDGDLNFDLNDVVHANIIDLFDKSNLFCKNECKIAFKCQAGVSRSCTVLVAFLMRHNGMALKDALSYCHSIRPQMKINSGFMYQLQLYATMNCTIDQLNPDYRKFKAWHNLKSRDVTINNNNFGEDPEMLAINHSVIKCKNCRRKLAFYSLENNHQSCMGNIVIEPLKWMSVEQLQGKLKCPRCDHKIGSYLWQGRQCACGIHIAPFFTLSPNKVDIFR